jgi:DNA-binding response OmpR family regulator
MPGIDGKELFERLSNRRPGTRVLYMSGYTDDTILNRGILEEGSNYIQKPFTIQSLATRIREILD